MPSLTITADNEAALIEAGNKLVKELAKDNTPGLSVNVRSGTAMNPQVRDLMREQEMAGEISYDGRAGAEAYLPGQRLNDPMEGPEAVSRESYATVNNTVPEATSEQKSMTKKLQQDADKAQEQQRQSAEETLQKVEQQAEQDKEAAEEATKLAAARGVIPVVGPSIPEGTDVQKVALVENPEGEEPKKGTNAKTSTGKKK